MVSKHAMYAWAFCAWRQGQAAWASAYFQVSPDRIAWLRLMTHPPIPISSPSAHAPAAARQGRTGPCFRGVGWCVLNASCQPIEALLGVFLELGLCGLRV